MLNEIITTGGIDYTVQNLCTGLNTISFVVQMTVDEAESVFKNVTELAVKSEDGEVYGEYSNVVYASVMKDAGGSVTITMQIPTQMEQQIAALQKSQAATDKSQAEQDEAIAECLYGRGEN
ncbi:MAG: hypothetical protein K1W38_10330 [Lachnospiraceae bacterium]|jgi:hypothetical protein